MGAVNINGFKSSTILRMNEWLKIKLSEIFDTVMKEPQTSACVHQFRMGTLIILSVLLLILMVNTKLTSQSKPSESPTKVVPTKSQNRKHTYYGERLGWSGKPKLFSLTTLDDGKIVNSEFYDMIGNKIGNCSYIDNYPYAGTIFEHDLIWTKITKKTYLNGFVVGTIIDYDIRFNEMNKYSADNAPTIYEENHQKARTKDGNPFNGKFVVGYALIEYKDGLMHGLFKGFDFLTRDTVEITSFKNGKRDGISQYLAIKDSVLAQGYYKNDKPFSGSFLDGSYYSFKTFNVYEDGVLVRINTYQFEDNNTRITSYKLINSCSFIDDKAYDGIYYDKKTYKFYSYEDGDVIKIYRINDRKLDTIEIQSFYKGKLNGYSKSKISDWINEYAVGYYKNGEPENGDFKDPKERGVFNRFVDYRHVATLDYSFGLPLNFYTIKNSKKDGPSLQRIQHRKDTTRLHSIYKEGLPLEGQICIKDEIFTYKDGKLNGQSILLDGTKINARKITNYKDGVITKMVNYKVFYTIDSITTDYVNGLIIDGQDIQYDDYSTKLYVYKNGSITGDSTLFRHEKSYMIYKNGRKFEGIEYNYFDQYAAEPKVDLITTYKDYQITNMQGGAHKEIAHFDMSCDDEKCTMIDYSPLKYKTVIYNFDTPLKNVITYQDESVVYRGTLKENLLDQGSFAFINYGSRFDKMLEKWIYAIVTVNNSSTSIKVFKDNQHYAENYKIGQKLDIIYPVFNLSMVISFRYSDDYVIEYFDKENNKVIASCKFKEGSPMTGISLNQNESIISIAKFKDGEELKTEEVHTTELLKTLDHF